MDLTEYGRHFFPQHDKKNSVIPFKDHHSFTILVDILIRKYNHHAIITTDFSSKMHPAFLEALLQHLTHESIPFHLRGPELIYLDTPSKTKQKTLEKDFHRLRETLDNTDKTLLIAFTNIDLFIKDHHQSDDEAFLRRQIELLMTHPRCRFIVLTNTNDHEQHPHLNDHFATLHINGPTDPDVMTILKQQRTELENYHRMLIPEEALSLAYSLAERYLSTDNTLENALLLLDSSAARSCAVEFKPVLTTAVMLSVLSGWTQIPVAQLQLSKFRLSDFIQGMQQKVFGQDTAITIVGHELQQAQARLQQKIGPFCSFLFAGMPHSGKETVAMALVEQFFKQLNVLHMAQSASPTLTSIADLKVQRYLDKRYFTLKDVIRQTPYAVIMFENIEQASPLILDGLQELLTTGLIHDTAGKQYNGRQSIIILSTTLGANQLAELSKTIEYDEESNSIDLMQLVMSEQNQSVPGKAFYLPQEVVEKVIPDITASLPATLCQHLQVVPFLPLNKSAIEKIIRLKLQVLAKQLDRRHGIELGFAPEIVRYLTNDVLAKQKLDHQIIDMDKALKQLYFSVEQAILSQVENKNRPNQLYLQLSETGQLLRCDWLSMKDVREHAT
jgi:ATP-dependent Clp protease ATP-binding subunit ClpA